MKTIKSRYNMLMKDVEYFLNAEKEYRNTPHPDMVYIEEAGGFCDTEEPLCFLRKGRFDDIVKSGLKNVGKNAHFEQYGLTDVEILILRCFYADISWAFRDDNYHGEVPDLVREIQVVLESVIKKAPLYDGTVLHRRINDYDPHDLKEGDIYSPTHSLTTSVDEFEKDATSYIITCLPNNKTQAHSLYKIYEHGNEKQVNFPMGTRFRVTKVIIKANDVKKIYMDEI